MTSLDDVILRVLMPVMREYYRNLFSEMKAHKDTLAVFQAALDGTLPDGALVVNADGWQIQAPRPSVPAIPVIADTTGGLPGMAEAVATLRTEQAQNGINPLAALKSAN